MNDVSKKQPPYRTLKKRLKARERTIQRLRNKVAWLELQLTLHFVEDRRAGGEAEDEADDTEDRGDDCSKCTKLRNMLNASIQVQQIAEWGRRAGGAPNALAQVQYAAQQEMSNDCNKEGNDVMLEIDPSLVALHVNQQSDNARQLPENTGFLGIQSSGNICCAFIVAVAILFASWF